MPGFRSCCFQLPANAHPERQQVTEQVLGPLLSTQKTQWSSGCLGCRARPLFTAVLSVPLLFLRPCCPVAHLFLLFLVQLTSMHPHPIPRQPKLLWCPSRASLHWSRCLPVLGRGALKVPLPTGFGTVSFLLGLGYARIGNSGVSQLCGTVAVSIAPALWAFADGSVVLEGKGP